MKERAAYQASRAGQQTVETRASQSVPAFMEPAAETDQSRASSPGSAEVRTRTTAARGLTFPRFFTQAGVDPFDEVEWELRDAIIGNERGQIVFEQRDVEIPKAWSQ